MIICNGTTSTLLHLQFVRMAANVHYSSIAGNQDVTQQQKRSQLSFISNPSSSKCCLWGTSAAHLFPHLPYKCMWGFLLCPCPSPSQFPNVWLLECQYLEALLISVDVRTASGCHRACTCCAGVVLPYTEAGRSCSVHYETARWAASKFTGLVDRRSQIYIRKTRILTASEGAPAH